MSSSTISAHYASEEILYRWRMNSPVGLLTLTVSSKGLLALDFENPQVMPAKARGACDIVEDEKRTLAYVAELDLYFRGELREFTVPLDLRGTGFQKSCWQALLRIPYGTTVSYADIAAAVERPRAFRAVGMANHNNPIPIIVPCHRVIASDGSLCGYGGGLEVKRKLLDLERAAIRKGL